MTPPPIIRPATSRDLPEINRIFNHYVLNSTCVWQIEPESLDARRAWLKNRLSQHPVFAMESNGTVVGWGALSPYSYRAGWRFTVEDSVYFNPNFLRKGFGRMMLSRLISSANDAGLKTIIARISADQTASLELHRSLGFTDAGILKNVGNKFDRWLDCVCLQKNL